MERVWEIMSMRLYYLAVVYDVKILAFVLMTNHFHLLARFPAANLSEAVGNFMRETSREITRASHRLNQTWGSRHFRGIIGSTHYFFHAYKYVYRNPVHAGLSKRVETYGFSTLSGLLGQRQMLIPVCEDLTLFSDVEGTLDWLNIAPSEHNYESVKSALRKSEFALRLDPNTKRQNSLEIDML